MIAELRRSFARELLQKGTPIDLHPRAFEAGHCAQTADWLAGEFEHLASGTH